MSIPFLQLDEVIIECLIRGIGRGSMRVSAGPAKQTDLKSLSLRSDFEMKLCQLYTKNIRFDIV